MSQSILTLGDSYKYSHSAQYPKDTVGMYSYLEARGGEYPATVFFGLQYLLKYLTVPVTAQEVERTSKLAKLHGIPFDKDGWDYIVSNCNGLLPVSIKAIPEGTLVPTGHVLATVESTDMTVPWVAGFVETLLLKVWYPTTVATKSYYVKQMLTKYGSPEWAEFAYHNFGDRGSTSVESAAIGGVAHLTQFKGTDNFNSLLLADEHYSSDMAGYSVFATEHSTTTSWQRDDEEEFVHQMLLDNPDRPIMSFVADSYDVYNFVEFCTKPGSRIRELVESRPHQKFIFRPDSGDPTTVIGKILEILLANGVRDSGGDSTLFTDFGILWGDGIAPNIIEAILETFTTYKYIPSSAKTSTSLLAAENFVFGSGGDIMQNVNRDTCKFAMKCSSITVKLNDGMHYLDSHGCDRYMHPTQKDIEVYKDPITDPGKTSKRGKVTTYKTTITSTGFAKGKVGGSATEALELVFENGEFKKLYTLDEVRNNSITE